jgi:cysteine synthase A
MDAVKLSVLETIGGTPLVELRRLTAEAAASVLVKLESHNPGGSVKDRIGWAMIADAEERGEIEPGRTTIVELTSGNTGIALAMAGAARGYDVVLTMPESMSIERRRLLAAYGARLHLTPRADGMRGAQEAADEIAAATPGSFQPRQFDNPANPRVHYTTTGPEIAAALGDRPLGAFVAGVGTGGTISGAGRFLKERYGCRVVAVEPAESPIIAQTLAGKPLTPAPHLIQGIGANFIPGILDLAVIDQVEHVDGAEAIATARRLTAQEGILGGISSGANVAAALRLARMPEFAGTTIVTVAPSTGERYLSTPLWEGFGE